MYKTDELTENFINPSQLKIKHLKMCSAKRKRKKTSKMKTKKGKRQSKTRKLYCNAVRENARMQYGINIQAGGVIMCSNKKKNKKKNKKETKMQAGSVVQTRVRAKERHVHVNGQRKERKRKTRQNGKCCGACVRKCACPKRTKMYRAAVKPCRCNQ